MIWLMDCRLVLIRCCFSDTVDPHEVKICGLIYKTDYQSIFRMIQGENHTDLMSEQSLGSTLLVM